MADSKIDIVPPMARNLDIYGFQINSSASPYTFTVRSNSGLLFGKRDDFYYLGIYDVWGTIHTLYNNGNNVTVSQTAGTRTITVRVSGSGSMSFTFIGFDNAKQSFGN